MVYIIRSEAAKHYVRYSDRTVFLDPRTGKMMKKISPGRMNFCFGMDLACLFLILEVAKTFFNALAIIATLGCSQKRRAALSQNIQKDIIYGAAIPVGFIGMMVSPSIACKLLNIPIGVVPLKPGENVFEAVFE